MVDPALSGAIPRAPTRFADLMTVLDGDFCVEGIEGLRVVDASVFAHTGTFIASAVHMMSEWATSISARTGIAERRRLPMLEEIDP